MIWRMLSRMFRIWSLDSHRIDLQYVKSISIRESLFIPEMLQMVLQRIERSVCKSCSSRQCYKLFCSGSRGRFANLCSSQQCNKLFCSESRDRANLWCRQCYKYFCIESRDRVQTPCWCRRCYKMFCRGTDFSARRVDLVCLWNLVICLPKFSQNRCWNVGNQSRALQNASLASRSAQEPARILLITGFNMR